MRGDGSTTAAWDEMKEVGQWEGVPQIFLLFFAACCILYGDKVCVSVLAFLKSPKVPRCQEIGSIYK